MNTVLLPKEIKDALERAGIEESGCRQVLLSHSEVDQGAGLKDMALAGAFAVGALFPTAPVGGFAAELDRTRGSIHFHHTGGAKVQVIYSSTAPEPEEGTEFAVRFACRSGDCFVLTDPSGRGVALRVNEKTADVWELNEAPAVPPSEVATWCAAGEDEWLKTEVGERMEAGDSWQNAAAVALYHRHQSDRLGAEQAERRVKTLLAGGEPGDPRPVEWVLSLSSSAVDHLGRLAVAEALQLAETCSELLSAPDPADSGWTALLRHACCGRDVLQGTRNLLGEALRRASGDSVVRRALPGHLARLDEAMGLLDETGEQLIASLSRGFSFEDEGLSRTASIDWMSWWVRPVAALNE